MKSARQMLLLFLIALMVLQFYFALKIFLMLFLPAESSTFQRSEIWRIVTKHGELPWRQSWTAYHDISMHLKRAVIAAEDGDFGNHHGIEWDAIEQAWHKKSKAQDLAEIRARKSSRNTSKTPHKTNKMPKIVGGSTISQQLAKNLFLAGERTFLRKGQELVLSMLLESILNKQRILEIYLNNVEWGEGIFGAESATQHYFQKSATQITAIEAARLAVMLPRPKYFEKQIASIYLSNRSSTILARMNDAEVP